MHTTATQAPPTTRRGSATLRFDLRQILLAWVFGAAFAWTISGAALTQFARELGMPDYGFGILAALPYLGTLWQLPASLLLERIGHRRKIFLISGLIHRLLWTFCAMIPWLLPRNGNLWWVTLSVALFCSWSAANVSVPPWMSWMSDVVPRRLRGRFFSARSRMGQIIGIGVTVGVGYLLDIADGAQADGAQGRLLLTLSAVLAVAGILGAIDILQFLPMRDPSEEQPHARPEGTWWHSLMQPLQSRPFRIYLSYNFIFSMAVGCIGQYCWLYLFDVVKVSNWQANMMLVAVPLAIMASCYTAWGRVVDRLGRKPVLIIGGAMLLLAPVGWLFIRPDAIWLGYLTVLVATAAAPGVDIANFNIALDLAGSKDSRSGGSSFVALNSIAVAVGGIISGVIAGMVAKYFRDFHLEIAALHLTLTYHSLLFIGSGVLRAISVALILMLPEPESAGTRLAIRYMTTGFYENLRHAWSAPTRVVGGLKKMTYPFKPRR